MSKENKYEELRKIDVTKHIEKKGRFNYLSWTYAVDTLLIHDPSAWWEFKEPLTTPCGTMMVFCQLHAFDKTINMQLPVLDYKNNAIQNPNAFNLNTAMMRCLAKAIACTGIGLHIYAGEDLPPSEDTDNHKENTSQKENGNKDKKAQEYTTKSIGEIINIKTKIDLDFWEKDKTNIQYLGALKAGHPKLYEQVSEALKQKRKQIEDENTIQY